VFGSSRSTKGDTVWLLAENLGEKLAADSFKLVNGGYGGTMEAMAIGARKVPGAVVEGIISPSSFPQRGLHGNAFITVETPAESIQDRIVQFTRKAHAFVILPGTLGTLTEFVFVWNLSSVNKFSQTPVVPIFAFRNPWEKVLLSLGQQLDLPDGDLNLIKYVDTVKDLLLELKALNENS